MVFREAQDFGPVGQNGLFWIVTAAALTDGGFRRLKLPLPIASVQLLDANSAASTLSSAGTAVATQRVSWVWVQPRRNAEDIIRR
ncbi:hypothetical protein ACVIGB_008195 [Bradyrhizobium sp. USDA 4341]